MKRKENFADAKEMVCNGVAPIGQAIQHISEVCRAKRKSKQERLVTCQKMKSFSQCCLGFSKKKQLPKICDKVQLPTEIWTFYSLRCAVQMEFALGQLFLEKCYQFMYCVCLHVSSAGKQRPEDL